ncbi:unnamed protein product [Bemisia tabaci]|uniref:5'-deoxynucleotidase HDDC2 n=1 Tax=Bemisia tabaci TaxID=7038 RepID=A0A9P0ADT9_BEMTA|nr:unnamed protein product [Bemisia tabaci]
MTELNTQICTPASTLEFLEEIGKLKHLKRTGWVLRKVDDPETVSGHMYRMATMTFLIDDASELDKNKCMQMALIHDMAECIVGDLTPYCGVSPSEKHQREDDAMTLLSKLVPQPQGQNMLNLFKEYESQISKEAKFVKELDRLDMILQAFEYEKMHKSPKKYEEFFDSTLDKITHPLLVPIKEELLLQRSKFQ